jgi:hypothetical protein
MGTLRDEILQAQRTRSDLLKWKLGLLGVIGSVGLGFAGSRTEKHADLVLCALPLVCLYVDLLCRHLNLRMLVISAFMRRTGAIDPADRMVKAYELSAQEARTMSAFALESFALNWSTAAVSLAVLVYGVFGANLGDARIGFITSAVVGGLGTLAAARRFDTLSGRLEPRSKANVAAQADAEPAAG